MALVPQAQAGETISLTPAQIEQALSEGEARSKEPAINYVTPPARRISGEMGMMVGTGGARGLYGATAIPLGDNGMAGFSFSTERYGRSR